MPCKRETREVRLKMASSLDISSESATSETLEITAETSFSTVRWLVRIVFLKCSKGTRKNWCSNFNDSVRWLSFEDGGVFDATVIAVVVAAVSGAVAAFEPLPFGSGSISIRRGKKTVWVQGRVEKRRKEWLVVFLRWCGETTASFTIKHLIWLCFGPSFSLQFNFYFLLS